MTKNLTLGYAKERAPHLETPPIPAAQYLRMSRESQAYSLDNQTVAIQQWAALHGFSVTKTYADPGRSGVILKNRPGLQQLLHDIGSGQKSFSAVLVYDVSRWGRFQDLDESAHYEYICKSAGIPVYYCAEAFSLENTMPNLILKALKRTMAAEYSRDLGERTYSRQKRAAENGFWMSSTPGYGLRRMLLDVNGKPKHKMKDGERKAIQSDRVKIVLGPKNEVECVKEIFDMVISSKGKVGPTLIAQELNSRGITHFGKPWTDQHVIAILSGEKYCGTYVWGKLDRKLHSRVKRTHPSDWVICDNAIPAIVEKAVFERAQKFRPRKPNKIGYEAVLRRCKALLKKHGRLSESILRDTRGSPSPSTVYQYFDSLWSLYRKLNYQPDLTRFIRETERQWAKEFREQVLNRIAASCPEHIDIVEAAPNHRRMLLVDGVVTVSVLICRSFATAHRKGWIAVPHARERNCVTLLCLLNETNTSVAHYFVSVCFPRRGCYIKFDTTEDWFKNFSPITSIQSLYWDVWEVQGEQVVEYPRRPIKRYSNFMSPQLLKLK